MFEVIQVYYVYMYKVNVLKIYVVEFEYLDENKDCSLTDVITETSPYKSYTRFAPNNI